MWAGDPAAHSVYMRAGGSGGCMGAGSPAAYMKAGGSAPAVYSGHMGTGDYSVGTWGQSVTVGTWGHGQSGGPTACSGYINRGSNTYVHGAGGAATYSGYVGWVSS